MVMQLKRILYIRNETERNATNGQKTPDKTSLAEVVIMLPTWRTGRRCEMVISSIVNWAQFVVSNRSV